MDGLPIATIFGIKRILALFTVWAITILAPNYIFGIGEAIGTSNVVC